MYLSSSDNTIHFHATAGSTLMEYVFVNRNNCYYIKDQTVHLICCHKNTIFHYEYFHLSISYSPTGSERQFNIMAAITILFFLFLSQATMTSYFFCPGCCLRCMSLLHYYNLSQTLTRAVLTTSHRGHISILHSSEVKIYTRHR